MLYFSKLKIISVIIFTLLLSYFTASNFFKFDNSFFDRNINLGLDLQGGSYLLLEIDNQPVITQNLQNKLLQLKKYFKEKKINLKNISLQNNEKIYFNVEDDQIEITKSFLDNDDSEINPYFQQFQTHQFNIEIVDNEFILSFSKYGLVLIKNSSQDQAIEIVRRRVDEIGTNEPNILKQGNNRILVELPGLSDPGRIKSLLGKTANLSFRFITQNEEESFGTEKIFFENGTEEAIVSKRIILSGDNLFDAQPKMDKQ